MQKILLIEDNPEVRENTSEILELAGYSVAVAENGKVGVRSAMANPPDLIICDIMMPELDGYGVLHILNKAPGTSSIPFIFLTAKADKSDVRKGMTLGADDYITKPFTESELLDAVETRLTRSAHLRQDFAPTISGLNSFLDEATGAFDMKELARERNTREFSTGEILYREGDFPHSLFFVTKGRVKMSKMDDYGKDLVTDLCTEGDFLGYLALLEQTNHNETAEALEPTTVALVSVEDFQQLLRSNREVANRFIKLLAREVREKEERLLKAAYASVRERVAYALLQAQSMFGASPEPSKEINLSREDLAGIAGTATESLIRAISTLKEEGIIGVEGRKITVLDQEGLTRIGG